MHFILWKVETWYLNGHVVFGCLIWWYSASLNSISACCLHAWETVAEAKQTRHISAYLDEMVFFCHPVEKYAHQKIVEPPLWTIFVKFSTIENHQVVDSMQGVKKKQIRASVFWNMTSHWQILLLLFQSQALYNSPPNQKRTNFLDHPTKLPNQRLD